MFKNLTPRQIAIFCSGVLTLIILFILVILQLFSFYKFDFFVWPILFVLISTASYIVILFFLNKFIYRRIKLIYKIIHDKKVSLSKDKIPVKDIPEGALNDVSAEVDQWVKDQQTTIKNLQTLESYRRDFLGNVSHELKTPIFNIQGYVHTLLDGAIEDKQLSYKYLDRAAKNIERLQTIVEDLESISKLELGELVLEMSKFDIKILTEEVFEELELLAEEKNIRLKFKEGASIGYNVFADREYIRQVLVNLINNSIKYGKEGGVSKVSFYNMENYILVEVADNGAGIEKQDLIRIFDRFYRVDKSRSRSAGGSGLGLSIVKHIIEAHHQSVNVRSTPGEGSTFNFTLQKSKGKI